MYKHCVQSNVTSGVFHVTSGLLGCDKTMSDDKIDSDFVCTVVVLKQLLFSRIVF